MEVAYWVNVEVGIIRDSYGNTLFAYSIPLGPGTSNMAEANAMLFGLKWCVNRGASLVLGETDSMLLTKCVNSEWKPPWRIKKYIEEIQELVEEHGFFINHCYREANWIRGTPRIQLLS